MTMTAEHLFPLSNPSKSCGLRDDLPKNKRHHERVYLGTDPRHANDGGLEELHIYACARCGQDKATRKGPEGTP